MVRRCATLISLAPVLAFAQATDPRKALDPVYRQLNQLTERRDSRELTALLKATTTKDFRYIGLDGSSVRADQLIASMRQQLAVVTRFTRNKYRIVDFKRSGNRVVVTVANDIAMFLRSPDGKSHSAQSNSITVDTWVMQSGRWKLREVRVTKERNVFDGKPVPG